MATFECKTLFILGAGSSCPYGYPSGEKLKLDIIENLSGFDNFLLNKLIRHGTDHLKDFALKFKNSRQGSIDAYLADNPKYEVIGKEAIAASILQAEKSSNYLPQNGDWFSYLFDRHIKNYNSNFLEAGVAFLTFNYDVSLEEMLLTSIMDSYGFDMEKAYNETLKIPIHHVYGQIRDFNQVKIRLNSEHRREISGWDITEAAKLIHVMYGTRSKIPDVYLDYLNQAKNIFILGFGFDKTNIERFTGIDWSQLSSKILASRFKMTNDEVLVAKKVLGLDPKVDCFSIHDGFDCLSILRNNLSRL